MQTLQYRLAGVGTVQQAVSDKCSDLDTCVGWCQPLLSQYLQGLLVSFACTWSRSIHDNEFWLQGFYIVTYALGIYNLNLLLGFLTPQVDPELEGPTLPSRAEEEFRPFVRRLPEFKAWLALQHSSPLGGQICLCSLSADLGIAPGSQFTYACMLLHSFNIFVHKLPETYLPGWI